MASPNSNRSSGFWGQDVGWDCCHEISAKDGEGVEEVFRVITRKLVEQRNKLIEEEERQLALAGVTPGVYGTGNNGYFDYKHGDGNASFRVGIGDKRRSWLGLPLTPNVGPVPDHTTQQLQAEIERTRKTKSGRCC